MYRECIEWKEGADEVGSTGTAPDLASADFLQMNKVIGSVSHALAHSPPSLLSLSLSLSHTHTHSLSLTHIHSLTHSLSLEEGGGG